MKEVDKITIYLAIAFICMLLVAGSYIVYEAYGEKHQDNITWKHQQLQEKFNNINITDYTSYSEQMEKIQRTLDYLKLWGLE